MTESPEQRSPSPWRDKVGVVVRGALLAGVLVFVALAVAGGRRPLDAGQVAPHLTLVSFDGNDWDLSKFAGRPVVVNFWGTWCPPCLSELPHFVTAAKRYRDDVVFIGAAVASPKREVLHIVERFGVPYPVAAVDGASQHAWNARTLPSTYVLDAEHKVVWSTAGALTGDDIAAVLDEKLGIPRR